MMWAALALAALNRWAYVPLATYLLVFSLGCGGAGAVAAVTATDVACEELEQQIEDRHNAGSSTDAEADAQISCTRQVCDAIIAKIEAGVEK